MITDRPKLTTKIALYGMSSLHFTARINLKSFPGMYAAYKKGTYANFGHRQISDIA